MKKWLLLIFTIIVLTINIYNVNAIDINNCISVQNDTIYILNSSFTTNQSKCFDINNNENITIDGNGYYINYTRIVDEHLIYGLNSNNIEIRNLKVYGWAFEFYNIDNLIMTNNNFTGETYNFFNNVSNILYSENIIDKHGLALSQLLHANEYISNLTMNNNTFIGSCGIGGAGAVFSIYSTLHNATIYDNYFENDCVCLTIGYKHDDINPYISSSGNIEIFNNEFHMNNNDSYFAMKGFGWGNANFLIYDNIFDSDGRRNLAIIPQNLNTTKVEIYNNEFIGGDEISTYYEIFVVGSLGTINNLTIRNNIFNQNYSDIIKTIYISFINDVIIKNNIINASAEFHYYLQENDLVIIDNETILKSSNYGLLFIDSNFGNITNSFLNSTTGFTIGSRNSNIYIYDSIIDSSVYDVKIESGGNITLYNTSIDTYDVIGSELNVYWKLNLDNSFNSSVKLYDSLSNLILDTTNETLDLWIKQYYVIPENQKTDLTPHNLEWKKSGYYDNFTLLNMNINRNLLLHLIEKVNITFQLPFEITGMYLFDSKCLDNETLYREYKKQSCIYTDCYEISDVQTVPCPFGCVENAHQFGDDCIYPDYQMYGFIIIVIVIIVILGLYFKNKD